LEDLPGLDLAALVRAALSEDVGAGDITTLATIPNHLLAMAAMNAREPLVVAGLALARTAFTQVSPLVTCRVILCDGSRARRGDTLLEVSGPAWALLTAERVALNFVQRLSGVATATARFVDAVAGTGAKILDTRKTTPGWRCLEKYAVRCGGGVNHRFGLHDQVLIKDNHLAALVGELPNPVAAAVRRARERCPGLKVEAEADSIEQVLQAVEAGADIILLDNMNPDQLRAAVAAVAGRSLTEASGGIRLEKVRAIAETGVDHISVGEITHSARSVDIGLDFAESARVDVKSDPA